MARLPHSISVNTHFLSERQFEAWNANFLDHLSERQAIAFLDVSRTYFWDNIRPMLTPIERSPKIRYYDKRELVAWKTGEL
jgi:hypothetical protein